MGREKDWGRELRHTWAVIDTPSPGSGHLASVVLAETLGGSPIRAVIDDRRHRHLLVPAPEELHRDVESSSEALEVSLRSLTFAGSTDRYLDIGCTSGGLTDLFDELLLSILPVITTAVVPAREAAGLLDRWRELLRARSGQALSHRAEMGLFAELLVLEHLTGGAPIDPDCWRGPLREPKDIVLATEWVEVKAAPPGADTITIHGLDQLEDVPESRGHLVVVIVEPGEGGSTIDEIVAQLENRFTDRDAFLTRLLLAGWSPASGDGNRWATRALVVVPVTDVPRLTTGLLAQGVPAGVRSVTYRVELPLLVSRSYTDGAARLAGLAVQR